MRIKIYVAMATLGLLMTTGCAAKRPVLFDNAAYKADPKKAESMIDTCLARAKERGVEEDKLSKAGKSAVKGGVASGAAGGAGALGANAVVGHRYSVGGSVAASAAAGTAGNFASGMMDDSVDEGLANYVAHCLAEKGYKVVTWK